MQKIAHSFCKKARAYHRRFGLTAEQKRQRNRDVADTLISKGSHVKAVYGIGEVLKVNKKTYTIRFSENWITTRDKSQVSLVPETPPKDTEKTIPDISTTHQAKELNDIAAIRAKTREANEQERDR